MNIDMEFMDCNLSYGPDTMKGALPGCPDIGALRAELSCAGVAGGLVYYAMEEPILGNEIIARDINRDAARDISRDAARDISRDDSRGAKGASLPNRLYGCWSILPSCTGEIVPPGDLSQAMKKSNIAALALNPQANRYMPCAMAIGDYLAMAQERSIPVLMNTGRGLTLEQADALMRDFRDLTVILTFANCWPSDRQLRPFLDSYPNLYLDMSYIQTASWLPDITLRYGAERVLFGSAFPECYIGAHMMVIRHAELSDADKALIAGGNLKRLLKGARV